MSNLQNSHKKVNIIDVILKKQKLKAEQKLASKNKKKLVPSQSVVITKLPDLSKSKSAQQDEDVDDQELRLTKNLSDANGRGRIHAVTQKKQQPELSTGRKGLTEAVSSKAEVSSDSDEPMSFPNDK